ncbi:MAG: hypothetical protein GY833_16620 [Aestuariibacter sp.]|nr:hypothetical protein [Aestuariibacter sp.]
MPRPIITVIIDKVIQRVKTTLYNSSGTEMGTAANPLQVDGSSGGTVVVSALDVKDPCSGTQTNNIDVDVQSSALPTGAATSAKQDTGNTLLGTIDTDTGVIAGDTTSIDGKITACDTTDKSTATLQTAANALLTAANALLTTIDADTSTIAGDTTSLDAKLPAQGAAATAASTPVNIASDQTVPVSTTGVVDAGNSTTTPLGGNATFTGSTIDTLLYSSLEIAFYADQNSTATGFWFDWSADGSTWIHDRTYIHYANAKRYFNVTPIARYFRFVFNNGPTPQGTFILQTVKKVHAEVEQCRHSEHAIGKNLTIVGGVSSANTANQLFITSMGGGDGAATSYQGPVTNPYNRLFNGTTWDRMRGETGGGIGQASVTLRNSSGTEVSPIGAATAITEYNISCAVADTEYSQALPANTKSLAIKGRSGASIRMAFATGKVAGSTSPYESLDNGASFDLSNTDLSSVTVYVASSNAGDVVELVVTA